MDNSEEASQQRRQQKGTIYRCSTRLGKIALHFRSTVQGWQTESIARNGKEK